MTVTPMPTLPYDAIRSFLSRLGFDPMMVREVTMDPRKATVTVYRLNDAGEKYVDLDTGLPAVRHHHFMIGRE